MITVGAHISSGGSFPGALDAMSALGGNALQVFSRNPRGGRARALPDREAAEFRRRREDLGIRTAVLHAPYTVNLASSRPDIREFGTRVVAEDLVRGSLLGAEFLVMHPGSHGGQGVDEGLSLTARCLLSAWEQASAQAEPGDLPAVVLENMSGSGTEIGGDFGHLDRLVDLVDRAPWLMFCLDTAHAHGAGYDLSRGDGRQRLLADWEDEIGFERMVMVHFNDSLAAAGSHRDRHAILGEGQIGRGGLTALLGEEAIRTLPLIIESPVKRQEDYGGEIAKVRSWTSKGGGLNGG